MAIIPDSFEPLAQGNSLLHKLDPRAKMLVAAGFSLIVAMGSNRLMLGLALALGILCVITARLPLRHIIGRLAIVNVFIAFLWIMLPWSLQTQEGWSLSIDPIGLRTTVAVTLKANAIVLVMLGLVSTSPMVRLLHGLHHMRVSNKLVHLLMFFFRYIHVFNQEYSRMRMAMKVRAFVPRTNMHTYRAMAHLVGMLLVRSYDRAERVYQAMLCRGFTGTYWVLEHFHWHKRDSVFCIIGGLALLVLAALSLWPGSIL